MKFLLAIFLMFIACAMGAKLNVKEQEDLETLVEGKLFLLYLIRLSASDAAQQIHISLMHSY